MNYNIVLPIDYNISDRIKQITPNEWKITFDFIDSLSYDIKSNTNDQLKLILEKQYEYKIIDLKEQYEYKINNLQDKLKNIELDIKKSVIESYEYKINDFHEQLHLKDKMIDDIKNRINEAYEYKINDFQDKLNLKDQIINNIKQSLTESYEYKINDLLTSIDKLKNTQDKTINNIKQSVITSYDYKITALQDKLKEQSGFKDRMIDTLNGSLMDIKLIVEEQRLIITNQKAELKKFTGTNDEKGTMGEEAIRNILTEEFKEAIVLDTSGQTSRGDLLFKWRNLCCLIEVKNKLSLRYEDIAKFKFDIKDSGVNCGIFVSLHTDQFPGMNRDCIQIETVHDVPCVFIHLKHDSDLRYAVMYLNKIIGETVAPKNYNAEIIGIRAYFEKMIKAKQRELIALKKQLEYLNGI